MSKVTIFAEIVVEFDRYRPIPSKFKKNEISEAISEAVCGCSQVENVASVRVKSLRTDQVEVV